MKVRRKSFPNRPTQKKVIDESLSSRKFVEGAIPITARSLKNYQIQLFPDIDNVINHLKKKDYLDIACGINHLYPESLLCQLSNKSNNKKKRHGLDIHDTDFICEDKRIEYFKGSVYKTKFSDNSYDCITINNFLYFWELKTENLLKSFKELHRICKKGGEIRIFPVFFGNYHNDNIELFDYLNENFSIRLLRPQKDYSSESPVYLEGGEIKSTPKANGSIEYRANHRLMTNCLILVKL